MATAHPKPEKRKNARQRALDKFKSKNDSKDGTKPMTAAAKSKETDKAAYRAEKAKKAAEDKAKVKAQKADTKARKISAAKAAKAARAA